MKNSEKTAENIIIKLKITTAPVNVEYIAEKCDIQIRKAAAKDISGLLYRKDGIAFMGINSEESSVRQRFTIAHELGHFFLHHSKDTFIEYRDNKKNIMRGFKEIEANSFAASLLMPFSILKKDVEDYGHTLSEDEVKVLAKKYDVSEISMTYRLTNLGLLQ